MGCEFSDKVRAYKRQMIQELVDQFSEKSKEAFVRTHISVDQIPEEDTWGVYYQCKRTLKSRR